jgi:hypothetical protein
LIVAIKRLKYFTHQFLGEKDFMEEQAYHIHMRRLHNRSIHGWGIVEGLQVSKRGDREIAIEPGVAIDREGREIILENPIARDLSSFDHGSHTYITIAYQDEESDRYSSGGIEGHSRVTELPVIGERKHEPPRDGAALILARVRINENGHIHEIDTGLRSTIGTGNSAAGWVRLPFKPVRLEPLRIGEKLAPPRQWDPSAEFTIDVASAYCEKSARGTMPIPVPPRASRLKAFRICGTTRGKVDLELVRAGWNPEQNTGERKILFERSVQRESFDEHVTIEEEEKQRLTDLHALAISVIAEGKTEIWLVAARFE